MNKVKMTNAEVQGLNAILNRLPNDKGSTKFKYAVIKTIKSLSNTVESLTEASKPSEEYNEYIGKLKDIADKYCVKTEAGVLELYTDETYAHVSQGGNGFPKPKDDESAVKYKDESEKLKEDNKKVLDAVEASNKEFESLLKEKVEVEVHAMNFDVMATVGDLSYQQLTYMEFMLTGD